MPVLSKLWDAALTQLIASPQIANFGHEVEIENLIAMLPYDMVASIDLKHEIDREDIAMALLKKVQKNGTELVRAHSKNSIPVIRKITDAKLTTGQKESLLLKLRKGGIEMLAGYYKNVGLDETTAIALAEAQIP